MPESAASMLALLGIIDLVAAASLAAGLLGFPLPHLQAAGGLALVAKGAFFIQDILSVIDIALGIITLGLLWFGAPTLALALAVYLLFKGLYSFA